MKNFLTIKRVYLPNCSIGTMYYNGTDIMHTVEKPYLSNKQFISCVPPGLYKLEKFHSDSHPNSFIIFNHDLGVGKFEGDSHRYGCLIHVANFPWEVEGCIGPGLEIHPEKWGVAQSRAAMDLLNKLIITNDWQLEII